VNNVFTATEFHSTTGYGLELKNTRNTTLENCYMECHASGLIITSYSLAVNVVHCVWGSLDNTNSKGSVAFITHANPSGGGSIYIEGGYVYLTQKAETANLSFLKANNSAFYANLSVSREPKVDGGPTGFKFLADSYNYKNISPTTIDVVGNTTSRINVRLADEVGGLEIQRNRNYGGTGFGTQFKQFGTTLMRFREDGKSVEFDKGIMLQSPNGTWYKVVVSDGGVLSATTTLG
jgi:hypothetical protein